MPNLDDAAIRQLYEEARAAHPIPERPQAPRDCYGRPIRPPGLFERVVTWLGLIVLLNIFLAMMGWPILLLIVDAILAGFAVLLAIALCGAFVATWRRR